MIEEEIKNFKASITKSYKLNNRNLIYLRLSDFDRSLKTREEQIKDALKKLEADFISLLSKYPELKEKGFQYINELDNLQALCPLCNIKKSSNIIN